MEIAILNNKIWGRTVMQFGRIALLILLFLYIFDIPFNFLPYNTGVFIALAGWMWWILKIVMDEKIRVNKYVLLVLSILALATVYAYFYMFFKGTKDIHVPRGLLMFFILVFPAADLSAELCLMFRYTINDVLYAMVKLFVVQSIIIFAMFLIPDLKTLIFGMMRDGDGRLILNSASLGFRGLGLSFGVTWDLALLQSLGLIFIALLINRKNSIILAIFYLMIVGSIFIAGRTGFIGMGFSLFLMVYQLRSLKLSQFRAVGRFFRSIFLTTVVIVTVVYSMLAEDVQKIITESLLPFAFELFLSKGETGRVETASSNELKSMYFEVPASTLFFGDGFYDDPVDPSQYYMGTDAGYMRQMLFYGILGSSIFYLFYIALFLYMAYLFHKKIGHIQAVMICIIFFYFMLTHVKGDLLLGGDMPVRVVFLLFFYVVKVKKQLPDNNQFTIAKI